jgi:hypothetical protein
MAQSGTVTLLFTDLSLLLNICNRLAMKQQNGCFMLMIDC